MKRLDLTGQRFGRLVVLRFVLASVGRGRWVCACDCGNETTRLPNQLKQAIPKTSCGCYRIERAKTVLREIATHHGRHNSPEWFAWRNMRNRCTDVKHPEYKRYGGRGIAVCERWQEFENFFADMGERTTAQHSLDRFPNNDGNYEPGNCRWATRHEQQTNTRKNVPVTFEGETHTIGVWARRYGIDRSVLRLRLKAGWTVEKALTAPIAANGGRFA